MSQRTENILTYFVFAYIVFMSFFGMAYPLMNPSAYSEIILHGNVIPMVQNHVEINGSCQMPALIIDIDAATISCKDSLSVV